jgi:hypothetical protein
MVRRLKGAEEQRVIIMGFFDFFKANRPAVNTKSAVNVEWVLKALDDIGAASKTSMGFAPPLPNETATTKYLRQDGTWKVPPDNNTVYTHPTTSGNKHVPSGGSSGHILRWSSDGTATWGADNNTTYSEMSGTTLGLVKLNGSYTFTGTINIPTPALPS